MSVKCIKTSTTESPILILISDRSRCRTAVIAVLYLALSFSDEDYRDGIFLFEGGRCLRLEIDVGRIRSGQSRYPPRLHRRQCHPAEGRRHCLE